MEATHIALNGIVFVCVPFFSWSISKSLVIRLKILQPVTPLEPCAWLNKILMEVWPNYMEPKLSHKFSSMVEVSLVTHVTVYLQERHAIVILGNQSTN